MELAAGVNVNISAPAHFVVFIQNSSLPVSLRLYFYDWLKIEGEIILLVLLTGTEHPAAWPLFLVKMTLSIHIFDVFTYRQNKLITEVTRSIIWRIWYYWNRFFFNLDVCEYMLWGTIWITEFSLIKWKVKFMKIICLLRLNLHVIVIYVHVR